MLLLGVDTIIDIASCFFTVLALVFTLHLWLTDHLNEDETKFLESKEELLKLLKDSRKCIQNLNVVDDSFLEEVRKVNYHLEIMINYRFWMHEKDREGINRIKTFYRDSKYLMSTIRRNEEPFDGENPHSVLTIEELNASEIDVIKKNYSEGLNYTIGFIENWSCQV